jgi:hypothetical protein
MKKTRRTKKETEHNQALQSTVRMRDQKLGKGESPGLTAHSEPVLIAEIVGSDSVSRPAFEGEVTARVMQSEVSIAGDAGDAGRTPPPFS